MSDAEAREIAHPDVHLDLVAAQRVESFSRTVRIGDLLEVPRLAIVIEDDLLVKFAELRHQPNTSRTLRMPRTSASISAFVL